MRTHTFESVAHSWLKVLGTRVRQGTLMARSVDRNRRLLEQYLLPHLGSRPIAAITPSEVLAILKAIEARGFLETARRVKQRCSRVFRHAIGVGALQCDLTEGFRGLLERPRHRHRPSIRDPQRLSELLTAIETYPGRPITGIALKLAPLLFVRPGELRQARWRHIDWARAQWRIPAECMKSRVQHLVPLSRQALALLKALQPLSGHSPFLFPSTRDPRQPMHAQALSHALRKCGFLSIEVTPHGFRSTACTLLNELGWNADAIERQLAHGASDDLRRIYNYAQYLPARRLMMQAWADYLDQLRAAAQPSPSAAPERAAAHPDTASGSLTPMMRDRPTNDATFLIGPTAPKLLQVHISFENSPLWKHAGTATLQKSLL